MYEEFTRAVNPDISIGLTDRELKMVDNFVEKLDSSSGTVFLYNYFAFQFDYWLDKNTRAEERRLPMGWIVGKKAIDRWRNRREKDLYHCLKTARQIGLKLSHFTNKQKYNYAEIKSSEETRKSYFHNTEQGFGYCVETTTLYHDKSSFCQTCCFADECKKLLKQTFPKIYIQRGYEANATKKNKRTGKSKRTGSRLEKFAKLNQTQDK